MGDAMSHFAFVEDMNHEFLYDRDTLLRYPNREIVYVHVKWAKGWDAVDLRKRDPTIINTGIHGKELVRICREYRSDTPLATDLTDLPSFVGDIYAFLMEHPNLALVRRCQPTTKNIVHQYVQVSSPLIL